MVELETLREMTLKELLELKEEYGSAKGVAKALGLSERSVQRIYEDALDRDNQTVATSYFEKRCEQLEREVERISNWRQLVSDTVVATSSKFKPVPVKPIKHKHVGEKDEHMIIQLISDVHVGEMVHPAEVSGISHYSFDEFKTRCSTFKGAFTRLVDDIRDSYPVPTLMLAFNGDIATSEGVFPLQLARNDLRLNEQIVEAAFHMADIVRYACSMFPKVISYCIPGNHAPKDLTFNSDAMIYSLMAALLRDQENAHFVISDSEYCAVRVGPDDGFIDFRDCKTETNLLITHGHQVKFYQSLPYYGWDRMLTRISRALDLKVDLMLLGHGHTDAHTEGWISNGNWMGPTGYVMGKMQMAGRPSQRMLLFHPKHGITWSAPVYLTDKLTLPAPGEHGVMTPHTIWDKSEVM